jgi:hypothetical protein
LKKIIIEFISEKNKNGISEVSLEEMCENLPQIIEKQNLNMKMDTIFNTIRGELNKHEKNSNHKDNMQLLKRIGRGLYCLSEKAKNYVGR